MIFILISKAEAFHNTLRIQEQEVHNLRAYRRQVKAYLQWLKFTKCTKSSHEQTKFPLRVDAFVKILSSNSKELNLLCVEKNKIILESIL